MKDERQSAENNNGQKMYSYSHPTTVLLPSYSNPARVLLPSYSHPGLKNPVKTGDFREFRNAKKKLHASLMSLSRNLMAPNPLLRGSNSPALSDYKPADYDGGFISYPIVTMPGPKRRPLSAKKSPHTAKRPDRPGDRQKAGRVIGMDSDDATAPPPRPNPAYVRLSSLTELPGRLERPALGEAKRENPAAAAVGLGDLVERAVRLESLTYGENAVPGRSRSPSASIPPASACKKSSRPPVSAVAGSAKS